MNAAANATNATDPRTEQSHGIPVYGRVYLAIGLFGCVANVLALAIIRRRSIILGMATRWHLVNQCVCDGLCCFFLSLKWVIGLDYKVAADALGDFVCLFWSNSRPYWICTQVSLLNTMSLSVEHFQSVVHPVRHRRCYTKRKLTALLAVNWLFACGFQSVALLQTERALDQCQERQTTTTILQVWGIAVILVYILIPLPSMVYCNVRMIIALLKRVPSAPSGTEERHRTNVNMKERVARELTYTVIAVSCTLSACIYPVSFYFSLYTVGLVAIDFQGWIYLFTEFLSNLHFTVNPFIYILQMRAFRREVRRAFRCQQATPPAFSSMAVHDTSIPPSLATRTVNPPPPICDVPYSYRHRGNMQ